MATGLDTEKANDAIQRGLRRPRAIRLATRRATRHPSPSSPSCCSRSGRSSTDGWDLFFQRVVDALNNGFIYSAMALALVLIYKATGVVNFAQGNMAMFGTFIAYVLIPTRPARSGSASLWRCCCRPSAAAVIERVFIRPFDPSNHLAITIVTLAWFLMLGALAGVIWGADPQAFPHAVPPQRAASTSSAPASTTTNLGTWIVVLAAARPRHAAAAQDQDRPGVPRGVVEPRVEPARRHPHRPHPAVRLGAGRRRRHAGRLPDRPHDVPRRPASWARCSSTPSPRPRSAASTASAARWSAGSSSAWSETMVGGYIDPIGSELALGGRPRRDRHRAASSNRAACSARSGWSASDGARHAHPAHARPPRLQAWFLVGALRRGRPRSYVRRTSSASRLRISQFNHVLGYAVAILGLEPGDRLLRAAVPRPRGLRRSRRLHHDHPRRRPRLELLRHDPASRSRSLRRGLLVGLPALRIRGLYLAVVTLAVATVFPTLVLKYESFTGGPNGKQPATAACRRTGPAVGMPFPIRPPLAAVHYFVILVIGGRDVPPRPQLRQEPARAGPSSPRATTRRAPPSAASTCRCTRR